MQSLDEVACEYTFKSTGTNGSGAGHPARRLRSVRRSPCRSKGNGPAIGFFDFDSQTTDKTLTSDVRDSGSYTLVHPKPRAAKFHKVNH